MGGRRSIYTGGSPAFRGVLFRTINGGNNWLFQLPDTSIHVVEYYFGKFINNRFGWAYHYTQGGIHTSNGGDTLWYTGLQQVSSEIPEQYKLYQNYPNPFNPRTIISYELSRGVGTGQVMSYVVLSIYDITGKKVIDLVNQKQSAGSYQVDFSGNGLSSGVYFYRLVTDGDVIDTKKMILLK